MKNKFLYLLLFVSSLSLLLSQGCASPSCSEYSEFLAECSTKVLMKYGSRTKNACTMDGKKGCKNGFCVKEPGNIDGICYVGDTAYPHYSKLVAATANSCNPVFASRYNQYIVCAMGDGKTCNPKKMQACANKHLKEPLFYSGSLAEKNKGGFGSFMIGFFMFLFCGLILEGLLVFAVLKLTDRSNPKNPIIKALLIGTVLAVFTYPFVYVLPLPGMLFSSSLLMALLIVAYFQEVAFSVFFMALHVIWVWGFFSFFTASGQLHSESWLQNANDHRYVAQTLHKKFHAKVIETEIEQERMRQNKIRSEKARLARIEEIKKEKEKAEKEKAEKEAEKEKEEKKKKRRRRRRR